MEETGGVVARWEPMPAQKFRWDESSGGDSAGEWKCALPRPKRSRKSETGTRARLRKGPTSFVSGGHSEHFKGGTESGQQNDVDIIGAGVGASGAATTSSGASAGTVTGEEEGSRRAERRMERIQAALTQLGSGDDMKEVVDKFNQEMLRAKRSL